ncbi:polyketide synthase dehydratase domain-containing protein, partial [Kitasatospora sp. NPDC048296]|uniref:polyketide synthase dehydratase domain-containing protein n=1 Tax=Kitasatospora sp. NPDC048296 TaxID=3364048 RepID=UPI00371D725F
LTGRLSLTTHPWLADHAVNGTVILPGTAFVELALQAGEQVGHELVEELTLHAPLVLPTQGAVRLQVTVSGPDDTGRRAVTIHSRPDAAPEGTPWVQNGTGFLVSGRVTAPAAAAELTVWPPADATPVDLDGHYEALLPIGYEYGPAFQGLHAAWRRGGSEVFAEVSLAPEQASDAARFGLHPALLDAALHAVGLGDFVPESDQARLPFAWRGVSLTAAGATTLRVHVTAAGPETVTITVADTTGTPVATIEALDLRPVSAEQLAAAGSALHDALFRLEWPALAGSTVAPAASAAPAGESAVVGTDPFGVATALASDGGNAPAFADLDELRAAVDAGAAVPGVVFAPCVAPLASEEGADRPASVRQTVAYVLGLLQGWLGDDRFASSRLVLLTRGAVAVDGGQDLDDLAAAPVWGLVRSAQSENPDRFVVLDVQAGQPLTAELLRTTVASGEPQLAVRSGVLRFPQLARTARAAAPSGSGAAPAVLAADGTVLITGATGTLGSLVARHLVTDHGIR